MYGKYFASTFSGSMIASGPEVFAVWGYVIAHAVNSYVELNPRLLAAVIGSTPDRMKEAIEKLCAADPESRSKTEEGRRLIREGEYQYRVVNHEKYRRIRDEDGRREYNRIKKQEERARKAGRVATPADSIPVKQSVNDIVGQSTLSAHTEADTDTEESASAFLRAHDARIATAVPPNQEERAPASLRPQENPTKAPKSDQEPAATLTQHTAIDMAMAQAYAKMAQMGITGLNPGDSRLRALLTSGATVEEITGVALQGARTQRSSWAWVAAAVDGKRRDAARIGAPPTSAEPGAPRPGEISGRMPMWVPPPPPPPETPEQREAIRERLAVAKANATASISAKTSDQLAAQTLAALQAKRGTDFPMQTDRDEA